MNEVRNPEQQIEAPNFKPSRKQLKAEEAARQRMKRNLDAGPSEAIKENSEQKITRKATPENPVETQKTHVKDKLDNSNTDGNLVGTNRIEREVKSRFSGDNFREETSFDARAKAEHPQLNDLKSKCVYDVPPMGTADDQINRSAKKEYSEAERDYIKKIRDGIDAPTHDTVMQKVIGVDSGDIHKDLSGYLNPKARDGSDSVAQVYGFVSKAEDAAPFTRTPQECHDNLRLDYKSTQYVDSEQPVYAIRFTDGENYTIPYSEEFGGEKTGLSPFTGNGFISGKEVTIPEYTVRPDSEGKGAIVTYGEIYRINPDSSEDMVAYYDKDLQRFELCEEET